MKVNYLTLIAGAAIMLLTAAARSEETPVAALAADAKAAPPALTTTASATPADHANTGLAATEDSATYYDDSDPVRDFIVRAGAWGVHQTGNPSKVDEYQGRTSSPFWDLDGIFSNGDQTVDLSAWQSDDDDFYGRLHFYGGPRLEADLDWQQFPHELDTHNYSGWTTIQAARNTNGANFNVFSRNDVNPGQDYAVQVQEYKANFKGEITENLRWRVNAFGIDKEGYRQANAMTHCYDATPGDVNGTSPASGGHPYPQPFRSFGSNPTVTRQCHVTSQAQHIDWQTNQVEVALELRMDCDTALEYTHLVRAFESDDQQVINIYRAGSKFQPSDAGNLGFAPPAAGGAFSTAGYNIVPDNQTQIDRLKFATKIGCNTDAYLLGYVGYNEDLLRTTYRNFNGADLRITNTPTDKLALTAHAKYYREDSTTPLQALNDQYGGGTTTSAASQFYQESNLSNIGPQINREIHSAGIDARWRPFADECEIYRRNLSLVGGYEYSTLMRENADSELPLPAGTNAQFVTNSVFTQPNSNTNTFFVGVEEKWSKSLDTQLRYNYIRTEYPLYGITPDVGQSIDAALNSALPTQENRIELQTTWMPTDTLMLNATFYVENAMSNAPYVGESLPSSGTYKAIPFGGWTSNSLPFTLSAFWQPVCDWSFNAGFSEMDSWINQGVNAGPINSSADGIGIPWNFRGTANVFTVGTRFQATQKLSFNGTFEYVHGIDSSFAVVPTAVQTPPTGAPYDLGQWSLVKEQSFRFEVGADYILRPRMTTYVRYDYYDFEDLSTGLLSGTQNSVLGGVSAVF